MKSIEGKLCPECQQGRFKPFKDEIVDGVFVDADRCSNCGVVYYSLPVAKRIEALWRANAEKRNLIRIGNSLAVLLPASIVKKFKLKPKESVWVKSNRREITIQPTTG